MKQVRLALFLFCVYLVAGFAGAAPASDSDIVTTISGFRIIHTDPREFVSALRTSILARGLDAKSSSNGGRRSKTLYSLFEVRSRTLSGGSISFEIVPGLHQFGTEAVDGLATSVDLTQMIQDENGYHYKMKLTVPTGYVFNGSLDVEKHKLGSLLVCSVIRPAQGLMPVKLIAEAAMSALGLAESQVLAEKAESHQEKM